MAADQGKAPDPPAAPPERSGDPFMGVTLADLEAIRLLLQGDSVIDWHQLAFTDEAEVARYLRVNEFDVSDPADVDRLEALRAEAVDYLTRHFGYRIPDEVASIAPVPRLLLIASRRGRHQTYACITLKVMHVMHHLDGRELLFRLPISDDQLFSLVERKVVNCVEEIRSAGHPISEFAWSRKERDSLITKLLAKRDTIAAHVYDKLRFRLVTRTRDAIAPVLRELLHRLVPFNYLIPGESVNHLLPMAKLLQRSESLAKLAEGLQPEPSNGSGGQHNEFSGSTYRVINFVADLPLRLSTVLAHVEGLCEDSLGDADPRAAIFVLTEFQIMDEKTAAENEQGESSHQAYKERQHIRVKARLTGASRRSKSGPT